MLKTIPYKLLLTAALAAIVTLACSISIPQIDAGEGPSAGEARPTDSVQPRENTSNTSAVTPAANVVAPTLAPIQLPGETTNEEATMIELYRQVNPSVVNILTYAQDGNALAPAGQGSGFIYDTQGHIVTNSHVVHGANAVEISFSDGTTVDADVVGEDLHSDLAVLRAESLPQDARALPLAKFEDVHVGQTAIAIGNPFGLGGTLTRGIVSAMGRSIPALTPFQIPQAIQTDAPINPGNSGGPLLNLRGEVIGVNAQIETGGTSRTNSGIGFAIPVSIVAKVVPTLIEKGGIEWGWMGVSGGSVSPAMVKAMDLPVNRGAYIDEVIQGGPADKARMRGTRRQTTVDGRIVATGGDVIIAVDGRPVSSFDDILIYIALNTTPGQQITLTIIRDGKQMDVPLTLEPRPNEERGQFQP